MLVLFHKSGQLKTSIVRSHEKSADKARRFVTEIFSEAFDASVAPQPDAFAICERNDADQPADCAPLACVGLTFAGARSKLFSERYLEQPIEALLALDCIAPIKRQEIIEMGSIASRRPSAAKDMIRVLPMVAWFFGMRFIICTATANLRQLMTALKIPFVVVAEARIDRLSPLERKNWGRYYENAPQTCIIRVDECDHLFSNQCGRFSILEPTPPRVMEQEAVQ